MTGEVATWGPQSSIDECSSPERIREALRAEAELSALQRKRSSRAGRCKVLFRRFLTLRLLLRGGGGVDTAASDAAAAQERGLGAEAADRDVALDRTLLPLGKSGRHEATYL